jgi:hypothetical protein
MLKEPEIVKTLKEEEKIGKLKYYDINLKDRFFEIIGINQNNNNNSNFIKNTPTITSYKDALQLARKVMKDLKKD